MQTEEKHRKPGKKKMHRKQAVILLFVCVILLISLLSGGLVFAKYYKTGFNKGIATAAGFYFNSNYLTEIENQKFTNIMDLKDWSELNTKIAQVSNTTPWSGSDSYSFEVQMQNFDNQLLYNDKDLDVGNTIQFLLLDAPTGAVYRVSKTGGAVQELALNTPVSFTGEEIKGGSADYIPYTLSVSMTGTVDDYTPSRILVLAWPTSPQYLTGGTTGSLACILRAQYSESETRITEQRFDVQGESAYAADDWKALVKERSGFSYQIKTNGRYVGDSNDSLKQTIVLKWRKDMYAINQFDPYYNEVKADSSKYYVEDNYQIMKIQIMPYSLLEFVFYKQPGFDTGIEPMDKAAFEASVQASIDAAP